MSDPLDNRVTKLEVRVDGHDKEIAKVNSQTDALNKALTAIQQTLNQIKWVVIGAGAAMAFNILGLKDSLKLLFTFL